MIDNHALPWRIVCKTLIQNLSKIFTFLCFHRITLGPLHKSLAKNSQHKRRMPQCRSLFLNLNSPTRLPVKLCSRSGLWYSRTLWNWRIAKMTSKSKAIFYHQHSLFWPHQRKYFIKILPQQTIVHSLRADAKSTSS